MSKRVAIVQSNYIPWKGYFDMIRQVDEFILFDDMQYTRRDWRNRNRIKTPNGLAWLTIPVRVSERYYQRIRDTEVDDPAWAQKHWRTLAHNYAKAPRFVEVREWLTGLFSAAPTHWLTEVNEYFLRAICEHLRITTRITRSMDYDLVDGKTERLVSLCRQAGASVYLSGPAARDYLEPALFECEGIRVEFMDYGGYPEYAQLYPPFEHGVSIIDACVHLGTDAVKCLDRPPAG